MMVRINLLPGKKANAQADRGRQMIALAVVLILIEAVFLYWLYSDKDAEVQAQAQVNAQGKQEIGRLKNEMSKIPDVTSTMDQLLTRKEALLALSAERRGPRHPLDMIKIALNKPMQEEVKELYVDEHGWDPNWDARNLILINLEEDPDDPGLLIFEGEAASAEDAVQFWTRLSKISLFDKVNLESITEGRSKHPGLGGGSVNGGTLLVHRFKLIAYANLRYRTSRSLKLRAELEEGAQTCLPQTPGAQR